MMTIYPHPASDGYSNPRLSRAIGSNRAQCRAIEGCALPAMTSAQRVPGGGSPCYLHPAAFDALRRYIRCVAKYFLHRFQ
jgi:hypothetical protein